MLYLLIKLRTKTGQGKYAPPQGAGLKGLLSWFILFLCIFQVSAQSTQTEKDLDWPAHKLSHYPGIRWHWMGSAVDRENLSAQLEGIRRAGIGNVSIVPIYGARDYEHKYLDFLSPEWMDMIRYTVNEAARLEMNVDMSTTTGWPLGGPWVSAGDAAGKMECRTFTQKGGEKLLMEIDTTKLSCIMAYSRKGEVMDITDKYNFDNRTLPPGEWTVYVVWQTGTGQVVKRAAPGGEGLVLNPFSTVSLNRYLEKHDQAFSRNKVPGIRAQFHDSYEYYYANWTGNLFNEFELRRGYDLRNHLPALTGHGMTEEIARIKADYRATMAELHLEYISAFTDWSHKYGWLTRNQAHGAPGNLLDLYAASDIPETEIYGATKFEIPGLLRNPGNISTHEVPDPLVSRFASSAAHVSGKQLVASETCTWLREHFRVSLAQMKPEIDQLFLAGINHIFYHGNAYSPGDVEWPGWLFYAAIHVQQSNAIWRDVPALNQYVRRCQSILQSGKPANDILLYWPLSDIWHRYQHLIIKGLNVHDTEWLTESSFGMLADKLVDKGYSLDYISDQQLQQVVCNNGKLETGGAQYSTIVIPLAMHMPIETWKQLELLARSGATIIFDHGLPDNVPGWFEWKERRNELQSSLATLQFKPVQKERAGNTVNTLLRAVTYNGEILTGSDIEAMLSLSGVSPEPMVSKGLRYIRRIHEEGYHYFIANQSDQPLDGWIPVGTPFCSAVILDPMVSDKSGVAAVRRNEEKSEIYLQLKPGESRIIRTFNERACKGEDWEYLQRADEPVFIQGEWSVEFIEGGPVLPAPYTTTQLASWTNQEDKEAKRFAGTALYSISFQLPGIVTIDHWELDLGEVRESARIRINGQDQGVLWSIPSKLKLGDILKSGENTLEVEVTNLSANRLRDLDQQGVDWQKYMFIYISNTSDNAASWPLMKSGLIGPVRLVPQKVFHPLGKFSEGNPGRTHKVGHFARQGR